MRIHGRGVEQPVARRAHNPKVVGSNPAPATNYNENASLDGRGVEQLVARRAHNPKVVGSNPAPATNLMNTLTGVFVSVVWSATTVRAASYLPAQ